MNLTDWWERHMRRYAVRNLIKYLCIGMLGVFILEYLPLNRSAYQLLYFNKALILRGEVWRVLTFLFIPPGGNIIQVLLFIYLYYFLGSALERVWGAPRFNLYYLIGTVGAVIAGFIGGTSTAHYLNLSLMMSFASLNPDAMFTLFFVLPIRAKWFGIAAGAYMLYELIALPWAMKPLVLLSLAPFFIFFGRRTWAQIKMIARSAKWRLERKMKK